MPPPFVALIASFSTFAIGFPARPLGGIVFGHFGETVGHKKMLVTLHCVQGLAIGRQWGGETPLVTESTPPSKRGFYGAFAQTGALAGVILANLAFLAVSNSVSEGAFADWGWRIPFIASSVLFGISIYVQTHLEDTPAFKALEKAKLLEKEKALASGIPIPAKSARSAILEAIRLYHQRILLTACASLLIQVSLYSPIAFAVAYGNNAGRITNCPKLTRSTISARRRSELAKTTALTTYPARRPPQTCKRPPQTCKSSHIAFTKQTC